MSIKPVNSSWIHSVKIFIISIFFTVNLILLTPVFLILFVYKTTVFFLAKHFRPDLHKFVPNGGNFFAYDEIYTDPKFNLISIWILDRPVEIESLQSMFTDRVLDKTKLGSKSKTELLYPEFKQHLTEFMGHFFWRWVPEFNVRNQIRNYDYSGDLSAPQHCTKVDLETIVCKLLKLPWEKEKPVWEILQIRNYEAVTAEDQSQGTGKAVLIFRYHHILGDGRSMMRMVLRDWFQVPDDKVPTIRFDLKTRVQKLLKYLWVPLMVPYMFAKMALDTASKPVAWQMKTKDTHKEFNFVMGIPMATETFKILKQKHRTSYNIVLLAFIARGIQRMMKVSTPKERGALKGISCLVPVALPAHPDGLVNHLGIFPLHLPVDTASVEEALALLQQEARTVDITAVGVTTILIQAFLSLLPVPLVGAWAWVQNLPCIFVSIFPGPTKPITIQGSAVVGYSFTFGLLRQETGITMAGLSYNGGQQVNLTLSKSIASNMKDAQTYINFVNEEVIEYLAQLKLMSKAASQEKDTDNPVFHHGMRKRYLS